MTQDESPAGTPPERPTVLVVDDEEDILESLETVVQAMMPHVRIVTAPSAEKALPLVEQVKPDVVVSDLRMPGTDGVQFLSAVRHRHPRSRRILMTAYAGHAVAAAAVAEAGHVLQKPFDPELFCQVLERAISG